MARRRASYTPEDRTHALALYVQYGAAQTEERTGIPAQTIRKWASREGMSRLAHARKNEQLGVVGVVRSAWEERRVTLVHRLGEAAELALNATIEKIKGVPAEDEIPAVLPDLKAAKDAALTCAILIDKAQLLSGGATSRNEVTDPKERALAAVTSIEAKRGNRAA